MNAQERLTLRAGYGPLDGPGPETRDDHAEQQVTHIGYGIYRADLRRGEVAAHGFGHGPTAALANAYVHLGWAETLEEAWARS
jgi:hypothetical protein